jgi:hypothetical protein
VQSVRERLADRTVRGELNARRGDGANAVRLEPASHEVIVVFYGVSGRRDGGMDLGSSSERGVLGWRDSGCCVDGAVLTVLKGTAMMIMRATMTTILLMVMGTKDGPLCIVSAHHVQTSKPPQVQHSIT